MKKVLLAALLGFGTLLPANEAKSSMIVKQRVGIITIEGWALQASSDAASGPIQQIQIYRVSTGALVRTQGCEGYTCTASLVGLPSGVYLGYVIMANGTAKKQFSIG